jgi:IS6 family transposase
MLSAKRDVPAAKRFFKKLMGADHRRLPFTIGTDKHASYPEAFAVSVKDKVLPNDCKLRRVKYLNNVIEQDHRAIRRRWRARQCFRSFHTAERTIEGIEAAHMMRKGQVKRLDGRDAAGQAKLVAGLFRVVA